MDIGELCTIRHRTACATLDSWWEFLPAAGWPQHRILMRVKLGSAPAVECEVPVCTHRSKPDAMANRWVVVRKSECQFLLTAARMPRDMQRLAQAEAFHPDLPIGSISLVDAPSQVARELSEI